MWDKLPVIGSMIDSAVGVFDSFSNRRNQRDAMENSISMRVADAKRAGIHPLAALGAQTFNPAPISTNANFSKLGQSLNKLSPANTMHEKKMRQIEVDYAKARTDNLRQQTEAIKNNLYGKRSDNLPLNDNMPVSGIIGQHSPRITTEPGVEYKKVELPVSSHPGIKAGKGPMEEFSTMSDGSVIKHPEKEKAEVMESDFVTQVQYASMKAMGYLGQIEAYLWSKDPKAKRARQILRAERPKVPAKFRNEYEYRYHPYKGRWFITKIRHHSYLYAIGHGEPYGLDSWR